MTDQTQAAEDQVAPIESLDQFAHLIGGWHHNGMSQLAHLLEVPEGETITIQLEKDAEAEELVLEGIALKSFKAALVVAMNIFNELPFGAVAKPQETANDAAASGN